MKVTFSISHQCDNKYLVKYIIPMPGQADALFISTITSNDWRLGSLITRARSVVYARLYSLRASGKLPKATALDTIVWDEAVADLPESFKRQQANIRRRYIPVPGSETTEPACMEVVQVNGVWTIVVHEQPLLTWAEACAELKKKVDGNE